MFLHSCNCITYIYICFFQINFLDNFLNRMSLFEKGNPKTSTKGVGFANEEKAKETILIIKDFNKIKQMQIILTMYYRAHHHPHRTKDMEKAMKIFKKWLKNNGYKNSVK